MTVRLTTALPADPEALFSHLYRTATRAVWLDSAQQAYGMGRYSIMAGGERMLRLDGDTLRLDGEECPTSLWQALAEDISANPAEATDLPFCGGWIGFVGYAAGGIPVRADAPDAALLEVTNYLVLDHECGDLHVIGEKDWAERTLARIADTPALPEPSAPGDRGTARSSVDRNTYLAHLAEVRRWLFTGDSYEACYTYRLTLPGGGDGFEEYRRLRRANPAPYASYLRLDDVTVLSSSPERFLTVGPDGVAETKPIKGTARRHPDPDEDDRLAAELATDPKTRAENLMIVDLLRNDLGRISEPGSVEVPSLMQVESYAAVHQLVTVVRSRIGTAPAAGVRAAEALLPPGSMTGAPKIRTVRLLDELEPTPRGVYSGAIGAFSRCGQVDLSVVIRTAVLTGGEVRIGTGGAITIDSDPMAELDETVAKSQALLRAFGARHPLAD